MATSWNVYRDRDNKATQREFIEAVASSDIAAKDAAYVRDRLPPTDRVWYEHGARQDVPTFNTADLGEKRSGA